MSTKTTYRLSILALGTGIMLMLPLHTVSWLSVSTIKLAHILVAILLAVMLCRIIYSHVKMQLSNPFKSGIKKWNGFKYLFYLILAFGSGVWLVSGLAGSWVQTFHLGIGAWSLLVGWKHTKTPRMWWVSRLKGNKKESGSVIVGSDSFELIVTASSRKIPSNFAYINKSVQCDINIFEE